MSEEGGGEKVPLWIISFADMITLLLSFFVMLQTMAHSRDAIVFGVAQDSFRRAIAGYGLPDLVLGKPAITHFDYRKLKYPTEDAPDANHATPARIIDAEDEDIRLSFAQIKQALETASSAPREQLLRSIATPVRFAAGSSALDASARQHLRDLAADLRHSLAGDSVRIYVIGAAPDAPEGRERWVLAALRASAAEEHLRELLAGELVKGQWEITSLGAAPAARKRATAAPEPELTVTIMRKSQTR